MIINGMTGVNTNSQSMYGIGQATDAYSKNIQKQIAEAQKKLQDLSSNEDLTMEEKMKKRQEIQKEIASLNQQLRQHQIEQRKEQQAKVSAMEDMPGGRSQVAEKSVEAWKGMSGAGMQAILSADASMNQVQVQSRVKSSFEGRAGVLKAEIKQDAGRNTEAKEAELAEVEDKVDNVTSEQMSVLSDIGKNLEEAAKEDSRTDEKKDAEVTKTENDSVGDKD